MVFVTLHGVHLIMVTQEGHDMERYEVMPNSSCSELRFIGLDGIHQTRWFSVCIGIHYIRNTQYLTVLFIKLNGQ